MPAGACLAPGIKVGEVAQVVVLILLTDQRLITGQIIGDTVGGWVNDLRNADIAGAITSAWDSVVSGFKSAYDTIGKTWVSFASIVVFVALGAGLYLGIGWASRATETSADAYFDQQAVHDFSIDYPYGFTADELERLSCVQGVTQVEAAYASFQTFSWDGSGVVARVQSLTSTIDVPECEAGELPTQAGLHLAVLAGIAVAAFWLALGLTRRRLLK